MIKCEVIENFTLEKFNQLKNVKKVVNRKDNEFGVKDVFECDKEMAEYLTGNNPLKKVVVKVVEVKPDKTEEVTKKEEVKIEKPKTSKKKKTSKK